MARSGKLLLLFSLCFCMFWSRVQAQAVYGSVVGTVTDPSGAAVPNATITATDMQKNTTDTVRTNESGNYTVQHLIPDTYVVRVQVPGFAPFEAKNITVNADTTGRVDIKLATGTATQTVEVTTAGPVLQTDRSDVSTVLDSRQTENIPNLTRNFTSFELLTPGTQPLTWAHAADENPEGSQQISVNGQLPFETDYLLDGTENQDPNLGIIVINPPLDSIAETKITTQNFDAEFGKAIAGVVAAQTKSGSNNLHGSAFIYRHSDAQLARDPFTQYAPDPATGRYIPPVLYSQFGGSVGGPLIKNKVFFFGDYQGVREKTGASYFETVPTALVHSSCNSPAGCNLSEYDQQGQGRIYDPSTNLNNPTAPRQAFAGDMIPTPRLSAPALKLLNLIPEPNAPGINFNYVTSGFGTFNTNAADARVDGQIKPAFHTFARYSYFGSLEYGPTVFGAAGGAGFGPGGYGGTARGRNQSVATGGDYAINDHLLTDFRLGFFRLRVLTSKYDGSDAFATSLGIPNLNTTSLNGGAPGFFIAGISGLGSSENVNFCNCNLIQKENQFQIVNNWTRILGNHTIKFGADLRYLQQYRVEGYPNQTGEISFGATATGNPAPTVGSPVGGLGLGTFLLGQVTSFQRYVQATANAEDREKQIFSYVQDTWRATDRLTVSYGLRWEIYFPETVNGKGKGSLLDLNTGNMLVAGYGNIGTNFNIGPSFRTFAPRLGLAYRATDKTVVRAGYGRSYDIGMFGYIFGEGPTENLPIVANQSINPSSAFTDVFNLADGPTSAVIPQVPSTGILPLPDGISARTRPFKMVIPTVDAWNVTVQQQLTPTMSFSVAYVGSKGTHNLFDGGGSYNPNQPTVVGYAAGLSQSQRRPYFNKFGWTQDLTYFNGGNNNTYNSLQVNLNKTFSNGLQFLSNYTWSKALGYQADYFDIDPRINYGPSSLNRGQVFNLSGIYELPFGRGKAFAPNVSGWLNQVIGGFTLNGDATWAGGLPFTLGYAECFREIDVGPCRPDRIRDESMHAGSFNPTDHSVTYFNPVQPFTGPGNVSGGYSEPLPEHFGNIGINSSVGPRFFNTDLAVNKDFTLHESLKLQLRAEAYNAFNHVNFGNPNSCIDCVESVNPGKIKDILYSGPFGNSMRQLQFSGRIIF